MIAFYMHYNFSGEGDRMMEPAGVKIGRKQSSGTPAQEQGHKSVIPVIVSSVLLFWTFGLAHF